MAQKSKGDSPAIIIAAIIGALATIIAAIITVTAVNQKNDAVAQKNEVAKEATSSLATNVVLQKTVDAPTPTLLPTNPPPPTSVPQATYTPYPTYTPRPALPTYTPEPTYTPVSVLATNTPSSSQVMANIGKIDISISKIKYESNDGLLIYVELVSHDPNVNKIYLSSPNGASTSYDESYFVDKNGSLHKVYNICHDGNCMAYGEFELPLEIKRSFYLYFSSVPSNMTVIPYFKFATLRSNKTSSSFVFEFKNLNISQ